MKRTSMVALLMLVMWVAGNAQATARQPRISRAEQELMQLEKEWSAAYLKHDISVIDRILADEFVGIDGRAVMTNKAQELDDAKAPKPGEPEPTFLVLDETISDMKVRVYGNVSVVNGRSIERVKVRGEEMTIQYRRTTVWVKRQGRWQCVSFHASRIPGP
jgi:ketosteroid isomerase-like protein